MKLLKLWLVFVGSFFLTVRPAQNQLILQLEKIFNHPPKGFSTRSFGNWISKHKKIFFNEQQLDVLYDEIKKEVDSGTKLSADQCGSLKKTLVLYAESPYGNHKTSLDRMFPVETIDYDPFSASWKKGDTWIFSIFMPSRNFKVVMPFEITGLTSLDIKVPALFLLLRLRVIESRFLNRLKEEIKKSEKVYRSPFRSVSLDPNSIANIVLAAKIDEEMNAKIKILQDFVTMRNDLFSDQERSIIFDSITKLNVALDGIKQKSCLVSQAPGSHLILSA